MSIEPDTATPPVDVPQFRLLMLDHCPDCQYSLEGLSAPTSCPECGCDIDGKTLVLKGVVKADASRSKGRRTLWIAIVIWGVIWIQLLSLIIEFSIGALPFGPPPVEYMVALGLFIMAWCVAFFAMIATGKRENAGTSVILFSPEGFTVRAKQGEQDTSTHIVGWHKVSRMKLKRISSVWFKLMLFDGSEKLLDAGFRSSDDTVPVIKKLLTCYRRGIEPEWLPAEPTVPVLNQDLY